VTRVRRTALAVLAAGVSIALLASCSSSGGGGKGGGKTDVGKAPDKTTNNAVNDMATTPRSGITPGGKMTWVLSQAIPNFNYWDVNGTLQDTIQVLNAIEPNPYHFDAAGTPSVNTDYFTSIVKTSDSPQTIEYKINPKAKWSDGSAITWADFASLWKACNGTNTKFETSGSQGWDQISGVTRGTDDQDVIVKYKNPYTDWQSLFQPLMPKSLTSTPKAFNSAWIGQPLLTAGPFKWGSQDKTAKTYTIVRDPAWWGDKSELDSITFAAYNDPSAAVQALGSREVDYDDISTGDVVGNVAAVKGYSGIAVRQAAGNNYRQFTLNTKDPLLSDIKVRQALVLGINRAQITTALIGKLGGNPTPLQNHFFMKNQTAYADTCGDYCTYDPAKAKSLLQSDGWTMKGSYFQKAGKELDVTITIPADTPNAKS
jgi:peptide/nickel transport system substrate-binding protein